MIVADDFGLGRKHDAVILDLLEGGRIDGASVMIEGAIAPRDLARLRAARAGGARVGLHLNVTRGFVPGRPDVGMGRLLRSALLGRLPGRLDGAFARQAEAFIAAFGSCPDFYDGHQHCHCLPGLAEQAAALPRAPGCFLRVPLPRGAAGLARNLRSGGPKVALIGALAFRARAIFENRGWPVNGDFTGFLRLGDPAGVARWLPVLVGHASADCLVMVHPGSETDPEQCAGHAAQSRAIEAACLLSLPAQAGPGLVARV